MSEVETRLAEIRERVEKATPGPWTDAIAPAEESSETPAEFLTGALCGAGPLYVVWSPNGTGDGFQYLIPAATGDGPESAANAAFIAAARSDIPWLLDQLARVRTNTIEQVEKLRADIHHNVNPVIGFIRWFMKEHPEHAELEGWVPRLHAATDAADAALGERPMREQLDELQARGVSHEH